MNSRGRRSPPCTEDADPDDARLDEGIGAGADAAGSSRDSPSDTRALAHGDDSEVPTMINDAAIGFARGIFSRWYVPPAKRAR